MSKQKNRKADAAEVKIASVFRKKRGTLAVAESCTGGLVSNLITDVPGSSGYFKGGIIAYSNDVKKSVLGVPAETLKTHGAVSRPAARAMAEGVRRVLGADTGIAVTGTAGPGGGSREKPVGMAYIAFISTEKRRCRKVVFKETRRQALKERFAQAVLKFILDNTDWA